MFVHASLLCIDPFQVSEVFIREFLHQKCGAKHLSLVPRLKSHCPVFDWLQTVSNQKLTVGRTENEATKHFCCFIVAINVKHKYS